MRKKKTQEIEPMSTFLSFKLNNEYFAIDVNKTLSILDVKPITLVPNSPPYLRGVINLRGNVLPIVDLGVKFGMNIAEDTNPKHIIVLCVKIDEEEVQLGVLADSVCEVLEIPDKAIESLPTIGTKYNNTFIKGILQQEQSFVMLLNIDAIFSSTENLFLE